MENKRILVTGGAGFIGSNLVEAFLKSDNHVTCLDNLSTGKIKNIEPFLKNPKFHFIEGDIRDLEVCRMAVKGIEFVFHQAALGSVPRSIVDPVSTVDVNVGGFVKMLTAAKDEGVKRFIYAASSSTYGDEPNLPKVEHRIGKPLSTYAVTKFSNEQFAEVFARQYGMEIIGLRYFNVFGRRQDPEGAYAAVIPLFVKSLLEGKSPVINGDGSHSRDFTYIDNVISANILAASVKDPSALNQVYNIACGESTSLNELYSILVELLSMSRPEIKSVKPVYGPERDGDVKHSLASIEKAGKLLGYSAKTGVKKGLENSVVWYVDNLK